MSYHSPISNRNPEPNNKQLFMLLGIFGGFFVLIIITFFILINQIINSIPVSLEHKLGALIIPSYEEKSDHSSQEKQLNQILDKLENLLPEKSKKDRDYQVLYIREDVVNAMAIPGDTIIIYEGLLKKIESENELVMILGHELGHFQNRDHLHRLGNMLLVKILLSYFLGDLETLSSGVDVINVIVNSQYSQKQESKADEIGLNLLNQYYGMLMERQTFLSD